MHIISTAVWRIVGGRLVAAAHQNALTVFELLIAGVDHLVAAGSHLFPVTVIFAPLAFTDCKVTFAGLVATVRIFAFLEYNVFFPAFL